MRTPPVAALLAACALFACTGIPSSSDPSSRAALTPAVSPSSLQVQAFSEKSTGSLESDGCWALYSAGTVGNTFSFSSSDTYVFTVRARGQSAGGAAPILELRVDGNVIGQANVAPTSLTSVTFKTPVSAGNHLIELAFTNDYYVPPSDDRNLFLLDLAIVGNTPPEGTTKKAAQFATKTAGALDSDGSWNLYSNGYLADRFSFATSGTYRFTVNALGQLALGVAPLMELRLDGKPFAQLSVSSTSFANYSATTQVTAGTHVVAIAFTNDYYAPPNEDRNLILMSLSLAPVQTPPAPPPLVRPAFFVSTSGNDANPGTQDQPFLTPTHARDAMRSSNTKTTYVRGGLYTNVALSLDQSSDNGTTWLGYPGETPVLDGNNSSGAVIQGAGVSNITLRWLTVQHARQGFKFFYFCDHITLDSNTVQDVTSQDADASAAIVFSFSVTNSRITHNLVQRATGMGIGIFDGSSSENSHDNLIDRNIVRDVNTGGHSDLGAIYSLNRGHVTQGLVISNNVITNYGLTTSDATKGIYLDDETSFTTVTGNIVRGTGEYGVQIHGGNDIQVRNNIFDLSSGARALLYQDDVGAGFPNYGMANNVWQNNILYSPGAFTQATVYDFINQAPAAIGLPSVANNLYSNASLVPQSGPLQDANPAVADPLFRSPATGDYTLDPSSPALNAPTSFTVLPTDQGPVPNG